MIALRDITEADVERLAILNDREAQLVNALGVAGLRALSKSAWAARTVGDLSAFVIALSHDTPSQGPNHGWFLQREPRFAYVDRVVVDAPARGRGVGRALYVDVARRARAEGIPFVCLEVDVEPPNEPSLAFHARLGFVAVGEAVDPRNGKRVRYMRAAVDELCAFARGD